MPPQNRPASVADPRWRLRRSPPIGELDEVVVGPSSAAWRIAGDAWLNLVMLCPLPAPAVSPHPIRARPGKIPKVLIRHADASKDAAACAAIYAPYVTDSVISLEDEHHPPDEREFVRRIERVTLTHPWLVAESEGAVAGYAYAGEHRERAAYRWATDVTVYIGREERRRGIGRALYTDLLGLLRTQGFHVACAGVTLPNDASVGFHESLGFTPVGTYRRIGWKMGAWWDVGWWQLELVALTEGKPAEPGPPARAAPPSSE